MGRRQVAIHVNRGRIDVLGRPIDGVEIEHADEDSDDMRISGRGGRIEVHGGDVDCDVAVPEDADVSLHVNDAEVFVHNVAGIDIRLNNGEIDVHDVDGPVDVHANNAEVGVSNVAGPVTVTVNDGNIWVGVAPGCAVQADLHSNRGDVLNTAPEGSDLLVTVKVNKGDITIAND